MSSLACSPCGSSSCAVVVVSFSLAAGTDVGEAPFGLLEMSVLEGVCTVGWFACSGCGSSPCVGSPSPHQRLRTSRKRCCDVVVCPLDPIYSDVPLLRFRDSAPGPLSTLSIKGCSTSLFRDFVLSFPVAEKDLLESLITFLSTTFCAMLGAIKQHAAIIQTQAILDMIILFV